MSHRVALCRTIDAGARIEAIEPFAKRYYVSSNSFIKTHLILFNVFAEGGAHMLGWVGDDIDLSPEFIL